MRGMVVRISVWKNFYVSLLTDEQKKVVHLLRFERRCYDFADRFCDKYDIST